MFAQIQQVPLWDIVIIGGGATGLGAAVDAASRGYKTLLIEQTDFSKGTSSRSTKLIHGGVRYLSQGNIKLVRESLKERGLLLKNAAHVCQDIKFILPAFKWRTKWYFGLGLKFYDLLAGRFRLGKTTFLNKTRCIEALPSISQKKLFGAVLYHDGQFDDSRLSINLAQTAAAHGACILNYCSLNSFIKTASRISAVVITDEKSHEVFTVKCGSVVNATGIFTDTIMSLDNNLHRPIITVSQGIHIVVEKHFFTGNHAMIIPTTDKRVLFAVPWHEKVLIGTTDTAINKMSLEPVALQDEINFIIENINEYLSKKIQRSDIDSVFAGLRPLIKMKGTNKTSLLPRDYSSIISETGLVTITGGKWTTYRVMGKAAIDKAIIAGNLDKKKSITHSLSIHGNFKQQNEKGHLSIYGSDAKLILELMDQRPVLKEKIHQKFPYTRAEIVWSVQHEMALTVEDVLARRTRILFLDAKAAIEAAPLVAAIMATEMNESLSWQHKQVQDFIAVANNYLIH